MEQTNPVETADRLARIETKLDIHLAQVTDHAARIKWLETKVNYFIGIITVVNFLVVMYFQKIMKVLNG